jgi:hypothetical protein
MQHEVRNHAPWYFFMVYLLGGLQAIHSKRRWNPAAEADLIKKVQRRRSVWLYQLV